MNPFIEKIAHFGIGVEKDIIERRRIIMLNIFLLIIICINLILTIINLFSGPVSHALLIFSTLGLLIPVVYFTNRQQHQFSRLYFILIMLLIINGLGYNSLFNFDNRLNEIYFIGFSSIIIILLDDPAKFICFMLAILSAIIMLLVRWNHLGTAYSGDSTVTIINVLISFICIYITTSIFKNDLVRSLEKVQKYSKELEISKNDLNDSRQLLRSLIDDLPILVALLDCHGNYIIVNREFRSFFQTKLPDVEGKNIKEIHGVGFQKEWQPLIDRCAAGKESIIDKGMKNVNGRSLHAYGRLQPIFNDLGKVTSILLYITDVSKLKKVEDELVQLNATKDKLISIVSHDLKAPINSLKGLLSIADDIDPNELKSFVAILRDQVDTVSFTLDNLLNWVRTQLNGFTVQPQNIRLSDIADETLRLYRPQIQSKNLSIKIKNDDPGQVFADKENLSLVYRNLISNAIKFTPVNGSISVRCAKIGSSTVASVADSGIGMDENFINAIMLGDQTITTRKGTNGEIGTGLGLAFCKDVLTLNKAKLEICSQINTGTEMSIVF